MLLIRPLINIYLRGYFLFFKDLPRNYLEIFKVQVSKFYKTQLVRAN